MVKKCGILGDLSLKYKAGEIENVRQFKYMTLLLIWLMIGWIGGFTSAFWIIYLGDKDFQKIIKDREI